jgi:hypothetical protein
VDEEVAVDNGLVTGRNPADIPAFNRKMVDKEVTPSNGLSSRPLNRRAHQAGAPGLIVKLS